jgi:hypothetical protein
VPSLVSFGAATEHTAVPVTLVSTPDALRSDDREIPLPTDPQWPATVSMAGLATVDVLPVPAADNFQYVNPMRSRAAARQAQRPHAANGAERNGKRRSAKSKPWKQWQAKRKEARSKDAGKASKRPVGHQIQVPRPTASLPAAQQAQ